jgi:hypothetical protein
MTSIVLNIYTLLGRDMDLAFPEQDNSEALNLRKSSINQTIETAYSSVCWLVRQTNGILWVRLFTNVVKAICLCTKE